MTKVVEMVGITKTFPGVIANREVDFELEQGEIHGLLGENGAGKTTLMNILYGLYQADAGEIKVWGEPVTIRSPRDAVNLRIGMVHQHFQFVPRFTVAENFMFGMPSPRAPLLEDRREVITRIEKLSEQYHLPVDPLRVMWQLSVGAQQRAEILRILYRGAEILILDEPTSVLTPQEVIQLADTLQNLVSLGKSVILITHKLDEVMLMTDRVTVMRDGAVVGTLATKTTTQHNLARLMVGREIGALPPKADTGDLQETTLQINALNVLDDRDLPAVKDFTLAVQAGEILGIAGVEGNGQIELEEALVGLRTIASGEILLDGKNVTQTPIRERRQSLAYIPSDRYLRGIVTGFTVAENLVLGKHYSEGFSARGRLHLRQIASHARKLVDQYQIRTPGIQTLGGKLSGGNAQRLILARELSAAPKAILACQPTRGLDVGATEYVHRQLSEQRNRGASILLISADLEEIMKLSDRIAVMYEGRIMGVVRPESTDMETLGLMMAGVSQEALLEPQVTNGEPPVK